MPGPVLAADGSEGGLQSPNALPAGFTLGGTVIPLTRPHQVARAAAPASPGHRS